MLVPAVLYKSQIEEQFAQRLYSNNMGLFTGDYYTNTVPHIATECDRGNFQFAVVDNGRLLGYFCYCVDLYADCVYAFGMYSFCKGNYILGRDVYNEVCKLLRRYHRIEWHMIGGNPAERYYDRFCKKYGGQKCVQHDVIKDADGNYHDDIIYEIVNRGGSLWQR